MKRKLLFTISFLLLFAGGAVLAQSGGGYDLSWNTVDGGGGTSNGGTYELSGTIGQTDAGTMTGGTYTLEGGFWGGVCAVTAPAVAPDRSSGAVELAWSESSGVIYDVYRGTIPYQIPSSAHATNVSSPWSDPVLGDPSTHHFYWILGGGCAFSQQVGEFEFPLEPGT